MEHPSSAELTPSSAWPRPSRAFSLVKQGDRHARAQPVGGSPRCRGRGRPFLGYREVSGLRCHRPRRFGREATMTNTGASAGTRRCICPHGSQRSWRAPAACFPRCCPWRRRCRAARITRKTLEPRPVRGNRSRRKLATGNGRRPSPPRGGGPKALRPNPERRAHHYRASPYAARFVPASCSAARLLPSRS